MLPSISSSTTIEAVQPLRTTQATFGGSDFATALRSAVDRVENTGNEAATAVQSFLSGEGGELHSTVLATQKASLEFDMFLQVRNKVVQAYQEVMRMQL